VKINDIIQEDLNTGTGTPNPDVPKPTPASKRSGGKVAGQTSMTPNAIRKREQRERERLSKQTTGGAGAVNQMANTVTTPAEPPKEEPTAPGATAFSQMANTLSTPATTTPTTQDNRDSALDGITDDEIASSIANMDNDRLRRAGVKTTLDPRVKKAVDAEIEKRNSTTPPATQPTQPPTPSTTATNPAQTTQQAQPRQSLWQKIKAGAQGAVQGYQTAKTNRESGANNAVSTEMAQRELKSWQTFLSQYIAGTGGQATPQAIQQAAQQFTANRYKAAGPAVLGKVNTVKDANSANAFITQAFNMAMANQKTGVTPPTPEPADGTAPASGGWISTPNGVQLKPATGNNPTVAKYKKEIYRLTSDNRWLDKSDRPVSQTMTVFLNNALEQT
jgi:hypothetical protein